MKKNVIFLLYSKEVARFREFVLNSFPQIKPYFFCLQKLDIPDSYVLEPGNEFSSVISQMKQIKVAAVVNKADAFETLHGSLVDYYKVPGPGYNAVISFKDKSKFQRIIEQQDLTFFRPRTISSTVFDLKTDLKMVQFPVVVKPFAGAKSRGIMKLDSKDDLKMATQILESHFEKEKTIIMRTKSERKILIEEFIKGKQFTCTCYVDDVGKLHILNFVDVITAEEMGLHHMQIMYRSCPSQKNEAILQKAKFVLQRLIKITGLRSTCLHPEFFVVGKKVIIIEINVRIGGHRSELLELSTGLDLNTIAIQLALGEKVNDDLKVVNTACACELWEDNSGTIEKIKIPKSKYIVNSHVTINPGENFVAPPYGNKPLGFFRVQDVDNALKIAKKLRKEVKIVFR